MLFTKNTQITLKYRLVTAEPPFSVKTIDWMHQTGPRILLSVTHMLYVNQVCHGVGRCVKDGSCSSSSLSQSTWTVLMGYLTISTSVRCYQTHHRWQFFFQENSALCVQHSPTAAALSVNTAFEWKMCFLCFPLLPGNAETQVIWGGILKHLLIAYYIGNISAKKYQNPFMYVKVIASHRWDAFNHGVEN